MSMWTRSGRGQAKRGSSSRRNQWRTATHLESLETRVVPSNMVWANRGQASDNFATVFGANAEAARRVVDALLQLLPLLLPLPVLLLVGVAAVRASEGQPAGGSHGGCAQRLQRAATAKLPRECVEIHSGHCVVCSLVLESRLPALDQAIHRARRLAGCETRPPPHAPG